MSASQDYVALDWIKGEISQTLGQAQQALETVAHSPDDAGAMRACLTHLHQVHGTLKMVELEGPTLLSLEMEELAQALMSNEVPDVGQAQEMLMQAILQMPAYLDRIQREQRDVPEILGPVVSGLRVARGEEGLPGVDDGAAGDALVLLSSAPADAVMKAYVAEGGADTVRKLRARYQQALVSLLKKETPRQNLNLLGKVFSMLAKVCGESPMGNLAVLGLAAIEGLAAGAIRLDNSMANLLKAVDGELKDLARGDDGALASPVDRDLGAALLAAIEGASKETPRIVTAKAKFVAKSGARAAPTNFGPDDETMAAVAGILIEELRGITDKLELYVRASTRNVEDLMSLVPQLEQIEGTLSVIGLDAERAAIEEQVASITALGEANEPPGDDVLLEMARAFLEIERKLKPIAGAGEDEAEGFGDVSEAEATVIKETRNGLAQCKDAVIEYVSSEFDVSKIEDLPQVLRSLRGGLAIINQPRSADVLVACAAYVQQRLLSAGQNPQLAEMDDLADALTSIDYYLERYLENPREPYMQMVTVAETAITKLGFAPGQSFAEPAGDEAPEEDALDIVDQTVEVAPVEVEPEPDIVDAAAAPGELEPSAEYEEPSAEYEEPSAELEEPTAEFEEPSAEYEEPSAEFEAPLAEQEEPSPEPESHDGMEVPVPAAAPGNEMIDDEILEIFVEEAGEVLETLREFFPAWRASPGDEEALAEVRRAFHTLKGSGRMVGATVVGELAWSIENMLNRVIDNTIVADEPLFAVVGEVIERIPEGIEAFRVGTQETFDVAELAARADVLASGGEEPVTEDESGVELELDESLFERPGEPVSDLERVVADLDDEEAFTLEEIDVDPSSVPEADEVASPAQEDDDVFEIVEDVDDGFEFEEIDTTSDSTDAAVAGETDASETEAVALESDETPLSDLDELEALEAADDATFDEDFLDDIDLDEAALEPAEETPTYDPELDEIFLAEAAERMETVRAYVAAPGSVTPDLIAAFHTLKGSAGMAEVPTIARVAAPLEKLANNVYNQGADVHAFDVLASEGAGMIEQVLSNLSQYRTFVPGLDDFAARADAAISGEPAATSRPTFDFENIRLLSTADDVLDAWDHAQISVLVEELREVSAQADLTGHGELGVLAEALLRVYGELLSRPNDIIADCLARAHEHLVLMLDQVAASQEVVGADALVSELSNLNLEAEREPEPELASAVAADETVVPAPPASGDELPEDDIDPDVLALFLEEAEELNENIDQGILEWSNDPGATKHLDTLLRHLHTLKGGARLAGLASLGEYTHNFETYLIDVQQHPVELDEAFFATLNDRQDEITRRVGIYARLVAGEATEEELASMRYATRPADGAIPAATPAVEHESQPQEVDQPEPAAPSEPVGAALPADEVDNDILPVFLEEAEELVESIDQSILDWSASPNETKHLANLLRHLHTLKGGSRLAGLASLGEYTHNFETFLIGIQQDPSAWTEAFFARVNREQDEITRRIGIYRKLAAGDASDEELASMRTAPSMDGMAPARDAVKPASSPAGEGRVEPSAQAAAETGAARPDAGAALPQQEMVRVSSDLLEELISLAGESSITRGRVEQQIADFGEALEEMEETINRIREQVRRLEIEAESRETVFRTRQRDEQDDSGFDDLELDRYSMLQEISRALSETSSDMMDLKDTLVNKSRDAETLLHQQARIGSELQEGLTRTRMVPFARLIPRLRRIVRQVSNEVGKSVRFDAYNVEGELDRNVLERIVAPLEHMLRNAVDHGIESAERRTAAGKQEQGHISLRLSREGGYVVLKVSDDGGGINVEAVKAKAIERGLIREDTVVSDQEVRQFIMQAGFSTAQKLTQISGRGVGMDVVASEIKQLGGTISIDSTFGVGTEFTIQLPFTVSINRALMVVVQDETYAIPLNTIEGIVRVSPYELEAYYQPDAPMYEYAGQPYRLSYMGRLLEKAESPNLEGEVAPLPVVLARTGDNAVALQVDRVIGSREVVVKSLGPQFNEVGGISGATVLGDGSVVIILDVMALVRSADVREAIASQAEDKPVENKVRTVMIVDDSVTVRKVTSRLMERQGWEVTTAKDGVDALNQLQDASPDIMLLDIEMPRMDGFEVLRSVRRDERLARLPIIMITSRTGEKHQQQALELGVNRYLGKPFQEANLLETIEEVIKETRDQ
ncbi:MAG: Hpt domain-containing protein [Pseudomonadales bacterium]|nr:Hpt domain-containing protein [Pseudomonadales bacterium]